MRMTAPAQVWQAPHHVEGGGILLPVNYQPAYLLPLRLCLSVTDKTPSEQLGISVIVA